MYLIDSVSLKSPVQYIHPYLSPRSEKIHDGTCLKSCPLGMKASVKGQQESGVALLIASCHICLTEHPLRNPAWERLPLTGEATDKSLAEGKCRVCVV